MSRGDARARFRKDKDEDKVLKIPDIEQLECSQSSLSYSAPSPPSRSGDPPPLYPGNLESYHRSAGVETTKKNSEINPEENSNFF